MEDGGEVLLGEGLALGLQAELIVPAQRLRDVSSVTAASQLGGEFEHAPALTPR